MARRWHKRMFCYRRAWAYLTLSPWFDTVWLRDRTFFQSGYVLRATYVDGSDEPSWRIETRTYEEVQDGP